jgi:predicted NAD/FAD-dependent oxidoreductase
MPSISLNLKLACTLLSLHRWRYSRCREPLTQPFFKFIPQSLQLESDHHTIVSKYSRGSIYVAGDAFRRSTIEGAYLSGHAAAKDLLADGI